MWYQWFSDLFFAFGVMQVFRLMEHWFGPTPEQPVWSMIVIFFIATTVSSVFQMKRNRYLKGEK